MIVLAGVLTPIEDALTSVLEWLHTAASLPWAWAIIALTLLVRFLLLPLTIKQLRSMQKLQLVTPELKAIQNRWKHDKNRQREELMKFYSENKINPFASCLPLLAQVPFFIGLFYLLQDDLRRHICPNAPNAAAANGKPPPCGDIPNPTAADQFLFIPDLTAGATGWVLAVLMLLYIASQLLSTLLTPTTPDRTQQMLMYGLPLVFAIFILLYGFPSGLLVYWITTNLWTVGQGYVLRKRLGPIMPPKPAEGETDGGGAGGGLLSKLAGGGVAPKQPAPAQATARAKPSGPPPPPPRKKKKRSGRRR